MGLQAVWSRFGVKRSLGLRACAVRVRIEESGVALLKEPVMVPAQEPRKERESLYRDRDLCLLHIYICIYTSVGVLIVVTYFFGFFLIVLIVIV